MAERVKYAAVGCGGMGRRHLNGMAALYRSSQPNMELVAVCDLNQENAGWLADWMAHLNALSPVTAWPNTSECTSCVPS